MRERWEESLERETWVILMWWELKTVKWGAYVWAVPAEEVCVLGEFDETSPHHDGLETLTVDRPELDVRQGYRHTEKEREVRVKVNFLLSPMNRVITKIH